jgi:phage shock protein C
MDVVERLYRSREDRMLAGVAGGLAERWDTDPSLIRILWAVLIVLTGGIALVVYIVMAIVVPEGEATAASWPDEPQNTGTPSTDPTTRVTTPASATTSTRRQRRRDPDRPRRGGLIFGALLILVGGYFLLRQFIPSIDLGTSWPVILIGLGIILVIVAVLPGRRSD